MSATNTDLPKNWTLTTLGDVTQPTRPRHSPRDYPALQFIGMEHVEAHTMKLLGSVPAESMRSAAVHFYPGDVLYGRLRPYLNKVFRPSFEGLCSAEFIVFPETEWLEPKYLQYLLNSAEFVSYASHLNTGDRPRVDYDQISDFPFPLAPLAEQKRIVGEIEKQFTRLDAAVVALKRLQANLKRYRASVRQAACEGRLVSTEAQLARRQTRPYETASSRLNLILADRMSRWQSDESARLRLSGRVPKDDKWKKKYRPAASPPTKSLNGLPEGWAWATVDQLADLEPHSITDGPFGSNLKTEHYTERGPRVIRLQNIGDGVFVDAMAHISQKHFERLNKHQVFGGDIVIAALGERPPRACIIPDSVGLAIVKADCIRFKPAPSVASAKYLVLALNAQPTRKRLAEVVHGVGRPRLNLGEIKSIVLPLPPIEEQHRIAAEAEDRISITERVDQQTTAGLSRAEQLRQAVLQRAFEGKLVPQDSNDEPAGLLLNKIRATRQLPEHHKVAVYRQSVLSEESSMPSNPPSNKRDLVETLQGFNKGLSPEELFSKAGYERETIDDFYSDLKQEVLAGRIREIRPDNKTARIQVVRG